MADLSAPPAMSTPAEHTFSEDPTSQSALESQITDAGREQRSDGELHEVYEIARTTAEIAIRGWRRVALQFPDTMLRDGAWVVGALEAKLREIPRNTPIDKSEMGSGHLEVDMNANAAPQQTPPDTIDGTNGSLLGAQPTSETVGQEVKNQRAQQIESLPRLYILADTSYSACCVDEIAAEHVDADAVVHYGRACLSPTARLPVLHIFTRQRLEYDDVVVGFEKEFSDIAGKESNREKEEVKVVVMADVMFQEYVVPICERLRERGWMNVKATEVVREPGAVIPNRRIIATGEEPPDTSRDRPGGSPAENASDLEDHHLFHISKPPTALLLTLSSRLSSLHIYPTPSSPYTTSSASTPDPSTTPRLLQRRYGLVLRLATASIIGILVNTLSVSNYLSVVTRLKSQIAAAGKKSYTIVVGKLNAAKLANFAEVDGWVVVGCWESGLVEQEGLWKPVITPFELELALKGDERVWDGGWWGGIENVGKGDQREEQGAAETNGHADGLEQEYSGEQHVEEVEGGISDEESEPPEFDWRTGRLISNTRPMRVTLRNRPNTDGASSTSSSTNAASIISPHSQSSSALTRQQKADALATVNGVVSPGAEYLRNQRTWQGLGSDSRDGVEGGERGDEEDSTLVEEGRRGVARGYTVGTVEGART
ncbi:Diphthamide biosynthesis protein 2 [Xylariales sp. AK1849]|nr:Diphthamide biosynthesis protein 2 [Xylariales sp. AK1849]